jgi:hypothetical protein
MFFSSPQPEAKPRKRCTYRCTCGNQWSLVLEVGDRATQRICFRCKRPCSPSQSVRLPQPKYDLVVRRR